jgi:hypothetical protein
MGSVITEINIDCANTERVAQFWAEVLGWHVQRKDDFLWMSESGNPTDGGLILVFAKVPEPRRSRTACISTSARPAPIRPTKRSGSSRWVPSG